MDEKNKKEKINENDIKQEVRPSNDKTIDIKTDDKNKLLSNTKSEEKSLIKKIAEVVTIASIPIITTFLILIIFDSYLNNIRRFDRVYMEMKTNEWVDLTTMKAKSRFIRVINHVDNGEVVEFRMVDAYGVPMSILVDGTYQQLTVQPGEMGVFTTAMYGEIVTVQAMATETGENYIIAINNRRNFN